MTEIYDNRYWIDLFKSSKLKSLSLNWDDVNIGDTIFTMIPMNSWTGKVTYVSTDYLIFEYLAADCNVATYSESKLYKDKSQRTYILL